MDEHANGALGVLSDQGAETFAGNPLGQMTELWIQNAVQWLRLGVETIGAIVIGIGILVAVWAFFARHRRAATGQFQRDPIGFRALFGVGLGVSVGRRYSLDGHRANVGRHRSVSGHCDHSHGAQLFSDARNQRRKPTRRRREKCGRAPTR